MTQGEYWITSPYCYCQGAALFAVHGLRHVTAPQGLALVPISGLSREETAILAAALLALAFFLFLLLFLCCCCCPAGLAALCCGCCSKKTAGAGKKSQQVDYRLPRAWVDTFKGVPEDQLDAKIRALESSGWAGVKSGGAGVKSGGAGGLGSESTALASGTSLAAGSAALAAAGRGGSGGGGGGGGGGSGGGSGGGGDGTGGFGYSYTHSRTGTSSSTRGRGGASGSTGVEDATGDFFFGGESLSREAKQGADARSTSGHMSSSTVATTRGATTALVDAGTIHRMTGDSKLAGLKTVQVVKETNQRTTTKFDGAGNKETSRTTTTTFNTSGGGLGSRLVGMIQGMTGFGTASGGRNLSIKERSSTSGGSHAHRSSGPAVAATDRFVSNLAEESQISSNAMQGRQLSVSRGRSMAGGSGIAGSSSSRQTTMRSTSGGSTTMSGSGGGLAVRASGGGGNFAAMSSDGDCGLAGMAATGGGTMLSRVKTLGSGGNTRVTTVSSGRGETGTGDFLYQREISREYNIHHPDSFLKLYHAYRRYLEGAHREEGGHREDTCHTTKYSITGM